MTSSRETLFVVVGAIVAVLLQLVLAPNIVIGNAAPNFLLEFALVVAVARAGRPATILAFILGLIFGLLGTYPVGAMAFALTAAAAIAALVVKLLETDSILIPAIVLMAGVLLTQIIYGILLTCIVPEIGILDALIYRALPCALYDAVLGVIILLVARKFMTPKAPNGSMGIQNLL